ncbi:hypothetical protein HYT51_00625 [Candidatus Woesearchaeota archaeon]|nr:hypothetical protein [Candidatus Woesearchaeota archaeon]
MGETKGSLEVRTLIRGKMVLTETLSMVEDSDNNPELLRYATEINVQLSDILTRAQLLEASGYHLIDSPQKLLEDYFRR